MRSRRIALAVLAASSLVIGAWAQVAPASFYRSFPAGRAWVAVDGPFNEHLIRDVGGLTLALTLLLGVAAWRARPELVRLAAGAALVYGAPHLAYHAAHLDPFGAADAVSAMASLAAAVVLPAWLVWSPAPRVDHHRSASPRHRVDA